MKYFTIAELCRTSHNLPNNPTSLIRDNLTYLINNLLDPIREQWGKPITVTSGFRNIVLNQRVGGVTKSQHIQGEAADITVGSPSENKRLFDQIAASGLEFDQLIDEENYRWLHVSLVRIGDNRKQILHLKKK